MNRRQFWAYLTFVEKETQPRSSDTMGLVRSLGSKYAFTCYQDILNVGHGHFQTTPANESLLAAQLRYERGRLEYRVREDHDSDWHTRSTGPASLYDFEETIGIHFSEALGLDILLD